MEHLRVFIKTYPIDDVIRESPSKLKGTVLNTFKHPLECKPLSSNLKYPEVNEPIGSATYTDLQLELEPISFENTFSLQCDMMPATNVTLTKTSEGHGPFLKLQSGHLIPFDSKIVSLLYSSKVKLIRWFHQNVSPKAMTQTGLISNAV